MPWAIFEQGSQICVYKIDPDTREKTGESLGCHPTREKAQAQVAALYANAGEKVWITLDQMKTVCPDCAVKMATLGLGKINLAALKQMPEQLREGLCAATPGESFSACMDKDFGDFSPGDKEGFCAWLHHECTGEWPGEKTTKAGARHSERDRKLIKDIHDRADEIKGAAVELGHEIEQVTGSVKSDSVPPVNTTIIWGAVKAAGDGWELDVLAVPFDGPHAGKDSHGEYFDAQTNTYREQFPAPLVVYYHGFTPDGQPQGDPVVIGKAHYSRTDGRGHWYRVALNKALNLAKRVRDAALRGIARASTGTIAHLKRVARDGRIINWPVVELSLFDTEGNRQPANAYAVALPALKAHYAKAGLSLPQIATGAGSAAIAQGASPLSPQFSIKSRGVTHMTPEEIQAIADAAVAAEQAEHDAEQANAAEQQRVLSEAVKVAVAQQRAAWENEKKELQKQAVKARRLPSPEAPHQTQFHDTTKFDGLSVDDMAFLCGVLDASKRRNYQLPGVSRPALKALAIKMAEDKGKLGNESRAALKAANIEPEDVLDGVKANELDYSTQVGFGDEWVGTEYSRRLWDAIRAGTFVLDKLPTIEVPEGMESVVVPLEAADPTWYKIAQTTDENATTKRPDATVVSSKLATDNETLTVAKMGARVQYTGELNEDSLIPWAAQLRKQLEVSGAEQLEHAIIDGDTATGASVNINHIGGTPGANDLFLLFNGFRKSPLVTTTANSRSAGGALVDTDFLETLYLMGTAGLNVQDQTKVDFIIDPNVHKKALTLASVKTRDVFTAATLEAGKMTGIWGYNVKQSFFMHFKSSVRKANTAGKVDQTTPANNTTGSILAVRYDQWLFGYKRRMTIKLQEWIDADVTQIVALARVGLLQRDTEASAITYNVGT